MLTMRFKAVGGLRKPGVGGASLQIRYAIQVRYGSQCRRTSFVSLDSARGTQGGRDASQSVPPGGAMWKEELELTDKEGQETIEMSLLLDTACKGGLGRKKFRHSVTTIEMETFRAKPEQRINMWQSLRSALPGHTDELGVLQLSATYSDDIFTEQGYMFGLFCGLLGPLGAFSPNLIDEPSCASRFLEDFASVPAITDVATTLPDTTTTTTSSVASKSANVLSLNPTPNPGSNAQTLVLPALKPQLSFQPVDKLELYTERTAVITPPARASNCDDDGACIDRGFNNPWHEVELKT